MNKTTINWGVGQLYTWNVITGCRRGCSYCYARRIYERYHPGASFSEVVFHEERLRDPDLEDVKPRTIFLGSMSDPEYYKEEHFRRIIETCAVHRQHTFMFLSKNPASYSNYIFPGNCVLGLTITKMEHLKTFTDVLEISDHNRAFLSIEPLLGEIDRPLPASLERIIVGPQTGPGATPPLPEWINSVKEYAPAERLFWKPNKKLGPDWWK
jgi:protein gp37